jgi:hypothetical protein
VAFKIYRGGHPGTKGSEFKDLFNARAAGGQFG